MARRAGGIVGESRAPGELIRLMTSPVWLGSGVARGDGRPVLVLPGLFGNDLYLAPLHGWLMRIGYRPVISTLAINAGCPETLRVAAQRNFESQLRPGQKGAIIGHSRGGMLGWAIAAALGPRISHLVLLGSPAGAVAAMMRQGSFDSTGASVGASATVVRAGNIARRVLSPQCDVPACGCPYVRDMSASLHPSMKITSIGSTEDTIVPAAICIVPGAENLQVRGSHSGLAQNVDVYRHIGRVLAS